MLECGHTDKMASNMLVWKSSLTKETSNTWDKLADNEVASADGVGITQGQYNECLVILER